MNLLVAAVLMVLGAYLVVGSLDAMSAEAPVMPDCAAWADGQAVPRVVATICERHQRMTRE